RRLGARARCVRAECGAEMAPQRSLILLPSIRGADGIHVCLEPLAAQRPHVARDGSALYRGVTLVDEDAGSRTRAATADIARLGTASRSAMSKSALYSWRPTS